MTDLLSIIKETYPEKYDYLRLGTVKVVGTVVNVTFLVPEDVYDYQLKSEDVHAITASVEAAIGKGYKVYCHFEKIVLTEENIRSALAEYLSKNFPLVAANLDFSRLTFDFAGGLALSFCVQKNIRDYMEKIDFDKKVKDFLHTKYSVDALLTYSVLEDEDIEISQSPSITSGRYGKSVQVTDKVLVYGKMNDLHSAAVHISTLRGEGEDVVCCGKVSYLSFKDRGEDKRVEGKRFYKHYYTFTINDTTGSLNVFINTDDECKALQNGAEVVCKGRVRTRDDYAKSMYVKSLALCKIPFSLIAEQTKPLDPPESYSVLFPKEYHEVTYDQIGFDFMTDRKKKSLNPSANCVSIAIRSLKAERADVPYEIAMCSVENGKIKEYVHTFLKVAFPEESETAEYANRMGYASPRLSTVIPDLIKFSDARLLVGLNPAASLELLNGVAKPLRFVFSNDVHVIPIAALRAEGERPKSALDEAVALANIFINE